MNSSYDEKKRKKSHPAINKFFSAARAGRLHAINAKAAKLAANGMRGESLLPHADRRISDCQRLARNDRLLVSAHDATAPHSQERYIVACCWITFLREHEWKFAADAPSKWTSFAASC
ncbi:hypothetical protein [Paraburkholderia dilworthii]|uniref:hypothetical protein n=1 Tax=Paraburkholderia dilworthii TaxID=948106 RepID=UPI0013783ED9|nr:hypothetical protein [Paraburkholderia dilworthii]